MKGAPEKAAYFGHRLESFQKENKPFWVSEAQTTSSGSVDTMQKAVDYVRKVGGEGATDRRRTRLPADGCRTALRMRSPGEIKDATFALERLRAIKRPDELKKLRIASERVIESMLAVIANHGPGHTTAELTEALRREETIRGLTFEYCLITAGTSLNRAPSDQKWDKGDILSLDSGGNYHGYIGDLCRMAIQGEPDAELEDMLAEIEQNPARVDEADQGRRHGERDLRRGRAAGAQIQVPQPHAFPGARHGVDQPRGAAAHGIGAGAVRRLRRRASAGDRDGDLGRDHAAHPQRGFIKLEDTVVVTVPASTSMARAAAAGTAVVRPGRLSVPFFLA